MLELSYIIFLEKNSIEFEKCEKKKYKIKYRFENKECSYFPDFFLLSTKEYKEIKTKNFLNHPRNIAKFKAAKKVLGNKFSVLTENDITKISFLELEKMCKSGKVTLDPKYKEKLLNEKNN